VVFLATDGDTKMKTSSFHQSSLFSGSGYLLATSDA